MNETESCYTDTSVDGNQDEIISKILVLSTSLLGVFLLAFGILRDFVSFGACRIAMFTSLISGYVVMAISTPGNSDYLQFGWILQFAGGTGIFLNGLQFLSFYPGHEGLLTGVANALLAVGTLIPQMWLIFITKQQVLTFTEVYVVWLSLALLSFILGTLFYPWNNMPQNLATANDGELDSLIQKLKKKTKICKSPGNSFLVQIRESMALMKSPIFGIHVLMFAVGNCSATLSLNFVNDYMCDYTQGDKQKFDDLQWQFEVARAAGDSFLCPTLGLLADLSMRYWNRGKSNSTDVQKTFLPYVVVVASNFILLLSLVIEETSIWFYLTGLTLCMGQVYMFETIGVAVNFPLAAQGIIFALIELAGALISLIQIPILDHVIEHPESDYFAYKTFQVCAVLLMILCGPVLFAIGFERAPKCIAQLDTARKLALVSEKEEEEDDNESDSENL